MRDGLTFWGLEGAAKLDKRAARMAVSGGAGALSGYVFSGGDIKQSVAQGLMAGGLAAPRTKAATVDTEAAMKHTAAAVALKPFDAIKRIAAPQLRSVEAGVSSRVIRQERATLHQQQVIADNLLQGADKYFSRAGVTPQDGIDFIAGVQEGKRQLNPQLDQFASTMRTLLDDSRDAIRRETGKLKGLYLDPDADPGDTAVKTMYQNYMKNLWKDPKAAEDFYANYFAGKTPLSGPKGFLKTRKYPTILDGIAAGLEPVTTNPVQLTMFSLREQGRYLLANRILQQLQKQNIGEWVEGGRKSPRGYAPVNDAVFRQTSSGPKGVTLERSYHVPVPVANVINNDLTPGWRGKYPIYEQPAAGANMLREPDTVVHVRFHMLGTAINAQISGRFALQARQERGRR